MDLLLDDHFGTASKPPKGHCNCCHQDLPEDGLCPACEALSPSVESVVATLKDQGFMPDEVREMVKELRAEGFVADAAGVKEALGHPIQGVPIQGLQDHVHPPKPEPKKPQEPEEEDVGWKGWPLGEP